MNDTMPVPEGCTYIFPTREDLEALFLQKYGSPMAVGWMPRNRFRFGYYLPTDVYEALVSKFVTHGSTWLDVGGGHSIFSEHPRLASELVGRCARVVAVDPSENVHHNRFVHERVQSFLEDYAPERQFDLATMRMVVEHVLSPERFVAALNGLVRPGGHVVVFTVNRWSPVSWLSWLIPFRLHHKIKRMIWGGDEKDTFPVHYRMNTHATLRRLFEGEGFKEQMFAKLDDLSTFGMFKWLNGLELLAWWAVHRSGFNYPENCLLGVYQKLPIDLPEATVVLNDPGQKVLNS